MCSWDEKAGTKIQKGLEEEILSFIKNVEMVLYRVILFSKSRFSLCISLL